MRLGRRLTTVAQVCSTVAGLMTRNAVSGSPEITQSDDNAHKVLNSLRDEGLLELNGKTYMLSLKVYETVKTDVAYVQDKTVSQIQAKDRILEYLKHKPWITNQKAQELCGFNKNQTYYILHQMCKDGILQPDGIGRGTKYKSVK